MKKFDWKIIIRANLFILNLVGLWPKSEKGYSLNLYTFYSLVVNIAADAHNVFQAAYISLIYNDLQAITAIIFALVTEVAASIKIFYFVRRINLMQYLTKELDCEEFQPRNIQQKKMVQRTLNLWLLMYRSFWITAGTDLCFLFFFPFMDGSYKEYRLPFWAWYPFDTKKSPVYELTYIYQVLGSWFLASCDIVMDTMFAALLTYIMAQCDILCHDLRNITNGDGSYSAKILKCIKHHKKILRFAKITNVCFNEISLWQFFTSSACLAVTMFQLTVVAPVSSEGMSLLFYVCTMTLQIFLYCWFGNEVEVRFCGKDYTNIGIFIFNATLVDISGCTVSTLHQILSDVNNFFVCTVLWRNHHAYYRNGVLNEDGDGVYSVEASKTEYLVKCSVVIDEESLKTLYGELWPDLTTLVAFLSENRRGDLNLVKTLLKI
ncbi:hypothetical protein Zmor_007646 [Zophobas morio]|uniref:Odorant receptor n=1 Tax=Zophobas morio TaxID=2755281 RepID=A0AA38IX51_9CUCU|nr:hypothetical protein Zmor_007646 [Zophobas morio]